MPRDTAFQAVLTIQTVEKTLTGLIALTASAASTG
jgi:hypothetical protein